MPLQNPGDVTGPPTPNPGPPVVLAINNPMDWADALLEEMGLPSTVSNETFLVSWAAQEGGNWNNTARYNPLNTTQGMPGSVIMSPGQSAGVQAYTSWQQGLEATAKTLRNGFYPQIMAALQGGNAMAVHNSGALNANLGTWGTGSFGANLAYGSKTGGGAAPVAGAAPAAAAPAAGGAGSPPPFSDLPALQNYIKLNFPSDAWLLNVPEVATTIEKAVAAGETADQVTAMLQQTNWWKHTSQALIAYDQLKYQNPEDLNFNNPGSKASAVLANVKTIASSMGGGGWSTAMLQNFATQTMQYGWTNTQIQQALGKAVNVTNAGPGVATNDPQILAQLTKAAGQYLVNPGQAVLEQYARSIAGGSQSEADWEAFLQGQAAAKYPSMAAAIKGGMTPDQIIDPLRQNAAQLMEVNPDQINFMSDPTYAKILTYRPPDVGNAVQPIRTMTNSEMETYLRGTNQYSYTQGARNSASDLSQSILTTLGKVAGT